MNMRELIEQGVEKTGSIRNLSKAIEVTEQNVSTAKTGKRGLPDAACLKLAQLLDVDFGKVIAARNEWTAKSEEEREFWHPLANAAGIAAISVAFVTSILMPYPAEAAQDKGLARSASPTLCIM